MSPSIGNVTSANQPSESSEAAAVVSELGLATDDAYTGEFISQTKLMLPLRDGFVNPQEAVPANPNQDVVIYHACVSKRVPSILLHGLYLSTSRATFLMASVQMGDAERDANMVNLALRVSPSDVNRGAGLLPRLAPLNERVSLPDGLRTYFSDLAKHYVPSDASYTSTRKSPEFHNRVLCSYKLLEDERNGNLRHIMLSQIDIPLTLAANVGKRHFESLEIALDALENNGRQPIVAVWPESFDIGIWERIGQAWKVVVSFFSTRTE